MMITSVLTRSMLLRVYVQYTYWLRCVVLVAGKQSHKTPMHVCQVTQVYTCMEVTYGSRCGCDIHTLLVVKYLWWYIQIRFALNANSTIMLCYAGVYFLHST